MARYIDADKLMELSQDVSTFDYVTKSFGCFSGVSDEDIAKIPTADVVEVKHGEWRGTTQFVISDDPDDDGYWRTIYICSECERKALNKEPYCHCGAKMDGERRDT